MSAITAMTRSLSARPVFFGAIQCNAQDEAPLSRVERIRRLLKASGQAMTAAEICFDMEDHFPNFGSHLVWLLLKYDISKGRVNFDGKYSWNKAYDSANEQAIRSAIKLLKKNGFEVKKLEPQS